MLRQHLFDPTWYLRHNPDVAAAVEAGLISPYDHFVLFGKNEGRSFSPCFDTTFYLQRNPDVADAVAQGRTTAIDHFLLYGQAEPRALSPFFDLAAYVTANPDVAQAVSDGQTSALEHLLSFGFAEGRPLGNGVSLAQFTNDPVFQNAASSGAAFDALARVAQVAPFLPGFEAPEGWVVPSDTPIPVDFVPVAGERLVIPPSVEIPSDLELPKDLFEPVETPSVSPPEQGAAPVPAPYVLAAAGRATGDGAAFKEGDTIILVFSERVYLSNAPFSEASAGLLGEGYTVTRAAWYDKGDVFPDDGAIFQYRVTLGKNAALNTPTELVLRSQSVANAQGRIAQSEVAFTPSHDGVLTLNESAGYPDWFYLAPDVDYELSGAPYNVSLAALQPGKHIAQKVTGSSYDDVFSATDTNALRGPGAPALELDGGAGRDTLTVLLDEAFDPAVQAPTVRNVETMFITAGWQAGKPEVSAGLNLAKVAGVEEIWNRVTKSDLELFDVRVPVRLGAAPYEGRREGGDYVVRFGEDFSWEEEQELALDGVSIERLSISKLGSDAQPTEAGLKELEIQLRGENRIGSFTEEGGGNYLSPSLKLLGLTPLGSAEDDGAVLALGEVWNALTIDMSPLKATGGALDLRGAALTEGALTIVVSALSHQTWGNKGDRGDGSPGHRKSEQEIALPALEKLAGSTLTIDNLTIASTTGYAHAPQENDVIHLSDWGVTDAAGLSGLVTEIRITKGDGFSAEAGEIDYVNWEIKFARESQDLITGFTLALTNLVTVNEYNDMLKALDTVKATEGVTSTPGLVGRGGLTAGDLYAAFQFPSNNEPIKISAEGRALAVEAIVGLVGILVEEGTIAFSEAAPG